MIRLNKPYSKLNAPNQNVLNDSFIFKAAGNLQAPPLARLVSYVPVTTGKGDGELRERAAEGVSIRQHTSAYVSIRQHTSAYVSIPAKGVADVFSRVLPVSHAR